MQILIIIGAALTLLGIGMLGYSIVQMIKINEANLSDDEKRIRLQRGITVNTAALGVSALGLILVVVGIILG